jgi:translation elongation factor EF-G
MGLRVKCAPEHFDAIKVALMVRNATLVSSEIQSAGGTIRACAPLAQLMGYTSELEKLTSGSAEHVMWLSHYAPVEHLSPDGGTA